MFMCRRGCTASCKACKAFILTITIGMLSTTPAMPYHQACFFFLSPSPSDSPSEPTLMLHHYALQSWSRGMQDDCGKREHQLPPSLRQVHVPYIDELGLSATPPPPPPPPLHAPAVLKGFPVLLREIACSWSCSLAWQTYLCALQPAC